jgi:hypothetical protein
MGISDVRMVPRSAACSLRPLQVKDANGVVTDLEYHARG